MTDSNLHRRTRRLPDNPNAEQLKNQAKDILKDHKRGYESCCEVLGLLKRLNGKSKADILASVITLQQLYDMVYEENGYPFIKHRL